MPTSSIDVATFVTRIGADSHVMEAAARVGRALRPGGASDSVPSFEVRPANTPRPGRALA